MCANHVCNARGTGNTIDNDIATTGCTNNITNAGDTRVAHIRGHTSIHTDAGCTNNVINIGSTNNGVDCYDRTSNGTSTICTAGNRTNNVTNGGGDNTSVRGIRIHTTIATTGNATNNIATAGFNAVNRNDKPRGGDDMDNYAVANASRDVNTITTCGNGRTAVHGIGLTTGTGIQFDAPTIAVNNLTNVGRNAIANYRIRGNTLTLSSNLHTNAGAIALNNTINHAATSNAIDDASILLSLARGLSGCAGLNNITNQGSNALSRYACSNVVNNGTNTSNLISINTHDANDAINNVTNLGGDGVANYRIGCVGLRIDNVDGVAAARATSRGLTDTDRINNVTNHGGTRVIGDCITARDDDDNRNDVVATHCNFINNITNSGGNAVANDNDGGTLIDSKRTAPTLITRISG